MKRIHDIKDIHWPFNGEPYVLLQTGQGSRREVVDPFPCYGHELKLVRQLVRHVEGNFPIGFKPQYNVLHFEMTERVNGWSDRSYDHSGKKDPPKWYPFITLSGKRIPIHPAMTRYVIPHEYGHTIQHWLERCMGLKNEELEPIYADMRGLKHSDAYGGKNWDGNTGEVLANDFRIVVCGLESEFWPHSVKHPDKLKTIKKWWNKHIKKYARHR